MPLSIDAVGQILGSLAGVVTFAIALWSRAKANVDRSTAIPRIRKYEPLSPGELQIETWSMWDGEEFDEDGERTDAYISTDYRFRRGTRVGSLHVSKYAEHVTLDVAPPVPVPRNAAYREPPYADPMLGEIVLYALEYFPGRQVEMHCLHRIVILDPERTKTSSAA